MPPAPPEVTPQGETLSQQVRDYQEHLARSRNALSPLMPCVPLLAVFRWHYRPPMGLSVANHMALKAARRRAAAHGIEPPSRRLEESVQLAKLTCSNWWRRKLRRTAGRRLEQVQREAHRVHKRAGIYCSDMTVERRRSQKVRNRALLETLEAINQEGQVYTLAELAELGLANPDHRRAELMLRINDTEAEARRLGHVGMFYTITTPSRFHPVLSRNARRNRKYDGSTPREAQQYLQALWAKARAKLAREELGVYGIRVVEPHHDGTPHWHLLLWMQPGAEPRVTEILREYAEAESPKNCLTAGARQRLASSRSGSTTRREPRPATSPSTSARTSMASSSPATASRAITRTVTNTISPRARHALKPGRPPGAFASSSSWACPASPSGARSAASPSSRRTSCAGGKKPPGPRRKRHHASPRSARPPTPASGISSCASWAAPTRRAANSPSSPGA
ncbi:hypothetical protein A8U91_02729 [Halomonas elongata]|uniref:Replication gene A protein-like domain-containing protein n=1 Tax=Halomonas elongata TaxID=2746 RepID=A0A1B8NUN3_HALEL|nr:replication endonuclease [Halomonas elongata]OBX33688.1 hypothetical protein A8U91_02729 [Halomonas elongata]